MRVFHRLDEATNLTGVSAIAVGNFDGVHLGHQALLRSMLNTARAERLSPTVLTFYPHPVEVLKPGTRLLRLTTTSEKLAILESFGVEQVLVAPFDKDVAALSPEGFFTDYMVKGLKARSIHVGFDFHFGKNRAGNTERLQKLAGENAISVTVQDPVNVDGQKVSSSLIRECLKEAHVSRATKFLGRPYSLTGQVSHGDNRGSKIGFPTANLRCPLDKALPKNGVYVTRIEWQKQFFPAVANVGVRPTFLADGQTAPVPTVEVHVLDFSSNLYEEFIRVDFLAHLRDEKKFPSVDALKAQIQADIQEARRIGFSPR